MSLTPGEIQTFTNALYDAFPTRNDLELLLNFSVGKTIEAYVTPSMTGLLPYAAIVRATSRDGWELVLLAKARELKPANPLLQTFERKYQRTAIPMPVDPHDAPVLRADRLFIDREDLRAGCGT